MHAISIIGMKHRQHEHRSREQENRSIDNNSRTTSIRAVNSKYPPEKTPTCIDSIDYIYRTMVDVLIHGKLFMDDSSRWGETSVDKYPHRFGIGHYPMESSEIVYEDFQNPLYKHHDKKFRLTRKR